MKFVHAQTVLFEDDLKKLKRKTGCPSTKDALMVAVAHYLSCEHTDEY